VRYSRPDVIDAIRYVARNGCVWRALPIDFPHPKSADDDRPVHPFNAQRPLDSTSVTTPPASTPAAHGTVDIQHVHQLDPAARTRRISGAGHQDEARPQLGDPGVRRHRGSAGAGAGHAGQPTRPTGPRWLRRPVRGG
jgi:hypothetical protein